MSQTTLTPSERAQREQREAGDPAVSAFVSAHAGSGKTTLLVNRLLRLMLGGADPARILCLTYTKAAAAEMALRLQKRLGGFVALGDDALDEELRALAVLASAANRERARMLFARVLDLPGGMRIETIHAFCQSLLKRFPLEAGVSPHFQLLEDNDAALGLNEAREAHLPQAREAVLEILAAKIGFEGFGELLKQLEKNRDKIADFIKLPAGGQIDAYRRVLRLKYETLAALMESAIAVPNDAELRNAVRLMGAHGGKTVKEKAGKLSIWLNHSPALRKERWEEWERCFFTAAGGESAEAGFADKPIRTGFPDVLPVMLDEQQRVVDVREQRDALNVMHASLALVELAAPMLALFARDKNFSARLDYDDLIRSSAQLLEDIGAAWVLYKLDAGLDHLLLDEVQDTSPIQWIIAAALTGDFFAGEATERKTPQQRTIFAVGDRKQSIYSFQGARPEEFLRWQGIFGDRARAAQKPFLDSSLDVSFRSVTPVLQLVDAVFSDPRITPGVTLDREILCHIADRAQDAGRIELWPLAPQTEIPDFDPLEAPDLRRAPLSAQDALVKELADYLKAQLGGGVFLESENRPLEPRDVLILVRHRRPFDRALTSALKARDVPVAGLDRLKLTSEPAVMDLLSLVHALLLPQDDLSFAEWLKSPLGGFDDDDLMDLAIGRPGSLIDALRTQCDKSPLWVQAESFFAHLLGRADFTSPYGLLVEILGPLGGRAKLLAGLGPDAAEALDELLAQALSYSENETPSLQGFVFWLENAGTDVKREADSGLNAVRIMTVHGAKGLEAPLVILPDTIELPQPRNQLLWQQDALTQAHLPLVAGAGKHSDTVEAVKNRKRAAEIEEYNRLLYVALTRARDRIVVCGALNKKQKAPPENCWYAQVERAMPQIGATAENYKEWGIRLTHSSQQHRDSKKADVKHPFIAQPRPLFAGHAPHWRGLPPPPEPARPQPLAPSRPEWGETGAAPQSRSPLQGGAPEERFRRGTLIHALLQYLPDLPPDQREAAALRYAGSAAALMAHPSEAVASALAVINDPALADLFGPHSRAEQPLAGVIGDQVIAGLVDRLAVLPDRVLIADYKTGRTAPADSARTPLRYLRQMAAYRAILRAVYPDRTVICLLIWTEQGCVQELPAMLLDAHAPGRLGAI